MEKRKGKFKKSLLIIAIIICIIFISFLSFFAILYNKYTLDTYKLTSVNNGIKVYSASGSNSSLYNTNRSIVSINNLPEYVKNAFIDAEDKRFYKHSGFDFIRIVKAGLVNLTTKSKSQGASTISQQLVKNALLSNEKTYKRKMRELVLSLKMEKQFAKDEILEMYLNSIYFGSNAYGIENASKIYFNKSSSDLSLNEACCLAGIIKSPAYYSPKTNYENAIKRRNTVASLMLEQKHISKEEYNSVINSNIDLSFSNYDTSYEEEAIYEACELLNLTERELINKDYEIITYKDDALQQQVINSNKILDDGLDSVSIVVNSLGEVQAYHVNSNYNLHNMKRQPASVLKPLAVYLPCITYNILTPSTLILDEPINYNGYSPKNADGKFYGYMSCRDSLSKSLNTTAVKLLDCVGLKKSKETLSSLGINLEKSDMNLSLALGSVSKGVSLMQLVNAYSTISNLGEHYQACFIDRILDSKGNIVYQNNKYSEQIIDSRDAFLLTDMLKETAKTGTAKRLSELNLPVASKTGTAFDGENNTDLYNISYTPQHTVLTWVSNILDGKLDNKYKSSVEPTEINKQILKSLYPTTIKDFTMPDGIEKYPYDLIEANENHIIVSPNSSLERYIGYDYFKTEFPPPVIENSNKLNLKVEILNNQAEISFDCVKNCEYEIIKNVNNKENCLNTVKDYNGTYTLTDSDIFNYDEICYIIKSSFGIEKKIIRPKDYLINKLNNQILNSKKKWYV